MRTLDEFMDLGMLATFAAAEYRKMILGPLLDRALSARLFGPLDYSPGGAAVVERSQEMRVKAKGDRVKKDEAVDLATDKWNRALIISPGTAVLGIGSMEKDEDGVVFAAASGPIMTGKSGYFLITAGVNAEPVTVGVRLTEHHHRSLFDRLMKKIESEISSIVMVPYRSLRDVKRVLARSERLAELKEELLERTKDGKQLLDVQWLAQEAARRAWAEFQTESFIPHESLGSKLESFLWEDLFELRCQALADHIQAVAANYGFINIEDATGPEAYRVIQILKERGVENAIWSDDIQGTGIIASAGTISWANVSGRVSEAELNPEAAKAKFATMRAVIFGAGAGAYGVYKELISLGFKHENILVTDSGPKKDRTGSPYTLHEGRADVMNDPLKRFMMQGKTGPKKGQSEKDYILEWSKGADCVYNLGVHETFTHDESWTENLIMGLSHKALFSAMTNPETGITPERLKELRPDIFFSSGNQRYPNPFNNFTAFGQVGLGALLAHARTITEEMTLAAAWAIHNVAKQDTAKYGAQGLVPAPDNENLIIEEAGAVAIAAAKAGVSMLLGADPSEAQIAAYTEAVMKNLEHRKTEVLKVREELKKKETEFLTEIYPAYNSDDWQREETALFYIPKERLDADVLKIVMERWGIPKSPVPEGGTLGVPTLLDAYRKLKFHLKQTPSEFNDKELELIRNIACISPTFGLALMAARSEANSSLFLRDDVLDDLNDYIPAGRKDLAKFVKGLHAHAAPAVLDEAQLALGTATEAVSNDQTGALETVGGGDGTKNGPQGSLESAPHSLPRGAFYLQPGVQAQENTARLLQRAPVRRLNRNLALHPRRRFGARVARHAHLVRQAQLARSRRTQAINRQLATIRSVARLSRPIAGAHFAYRSVFRGR